MCDAFWAQHCECLSIVCSLNAMHKPKKQRFFLENLLLKCVFIDP